MGLNWVNSTIYVTYKKIPMESWSECQVSFEQEIVGTGCQELTINQWRVEQTT